MKRESVVFEVKVSNLPESTTEEEVQTKVDSLSGVKANTVKLLKTKEGESKGVCFLKYSLEEDQQKVLALADVVFGDNTVAIDVPNKHVRGEGQNSQRRRRNNRDREERDGGERRRYNNRDGERKEFNGERREREVVAGDTVFVGNLAFAVKHDELKQFFDSCGSIVAVRIAMRDDMSRGFGYVQFKSNEGAKSALTKNGADMNGRTIRVNYQYSDNNRDSRPRNRDNRPRNNYRGRDRETKQE